MLWWCWFVHKNELTLAVFLYLPLVSSIRSADSKYLVYNVCLFSTIYVICRVIDGCQNLVQSIQYYRSLPRFWIIVLSLCFMKVSILYLLRRTEEQRWWHQFMHVKKYDEMDEPIIVIHTYMYCMIDWVVFSINGISVRKIINRFWKVRALTMLGMKSE